MKKTISIVLVVILVFLMCACGAEQTDTLQEYLEKNGITEEELNAKLQATSSPEPSTTISSPTPPPSANISPAPTATPTAAPTSTPQIVIVNTPTITKNPTSETVTEGGNATFVAKGTGYQYITWRLVSADGWTAYYMNEAPYYFTGLSVWGDGTTSLTLCNCPLSLSGWQVEAIFTNNGSTAYTTRASVYVNKAAKAQLYASPSSGYFEYCDQAVTLIAGTGDQIWWQLTCTNSSSYNHSGTITSGQSIYIPALGNERYDCYLYAYVVGDQSNAISCHYVMDCITIDDENDIDYYGMTESMYNAIITGTYDEDTNYLDDLEIPDDWN